VDAVVCALYSYGVGAAEDFQEAKKLVGSRIRRRRKKLGMNQERLAELANVDRKHMSTIENGNAEPGFWTLTRIAGALGTTPTQFLRGLTWTPEEEGPEGRK
jgi:transcriptional regulator with XRE-family HTH domain